MKTPGVRILISIWALAGLFLWAAPASGRQGSIATLRGGHSMFWTGPYIADARDLASTETCGDDPCFVYTLEVAEPAYRLRVAIDFPVGNDDYELDLMGPGGQLPDAPLGSGAPVGISTAMNSEELLVTDPRPGTWTVEVRPTFATDSSFRLRAKLEATPDELRSRTLLPPNLQIEPALEFGFKPRRLLYSTDGTTEVSEPTGSCSVHEIESGATRCLRFAFGPQNAGLGKLDLRFSPLVDTLTGHEGQMYQALHYSDGTTELRPAGTYEYHEAHAHYHATGFTRVQLLRVVDAQKGILQAAGEGQKVGFCLADAKMNSWDSFIHGLPSNSRDTCDAPDDARIGLNPGWTDIYTQDTVDNYVDFDDNPDGLYIVRIVADAENHILESAEDDNTSYSFIEVTEGRVWLIERGYGSDPWDPRAEPEVDWVAALR